MKIRFAKLICLMFIDGSLFSMNLELKRSTDSHQNFCKKLASKTISTSSTNIKNFSDFSIFLSEWENFLDSSSTQLSFHKSLQKSFWERQKSYTKFDVTCTTNDGIERENSDFFSVGERRRVKSFCRFYFVFLLKAVWKKSLD